MRLTSTGTRRRLLALLTVIFLFVLSACGQEPTPVPTNTPIPTETPVPPAPVPVVTSINTGVGDGTVSGNVFMPTSVTIPAGTTLNFTITSDEVHSVTFMGGGPPPGGPPTTWPVNLTTEVASVDGSALINTGLIPRGTVVSTQFPVAGSYSAICIIHPGMTLAVTVVESGQPYTSAADGAKTADQQAQTVLAEVDALRQGALDRVSSTQRPDGSTL